MSMDWKEEAGMRVYALALRTPDPATVYIYGRGVYVGDEVPPGGLFGDDDWESPKIVLDDGEVVWGFECWWGPETELEDFANGRAIVTVSLWEERRKIRHEWRAGRAGEGDISHSNGE